jgi:hypothetical protein
MKKLSALFILTAIAGLISFNAYARHNEFHGFGYGYGFGYGFGNFGMADFGGFNHFGGFGHGMEFAGGFNHFGGFGHGMEFTARAASQDLSRQIVPIPAAAYATNSSITYDEDGEIHVRPFDDEDLFVED